MPKRGLDMLAAAGYFLPGAPSPVRGVDSSQGLRQLAKLAALNAARREKEKRNAAVVAATAAAAAVIPATRRLDWQK